MSDELRQVFATPDGKQFDSKAEAQNYLRRPKILEAISRITGKGNEELAAWITDNQEDIVDALASGQIKRVSKAERNKLEKALNAIKEANNPKFAFVADNADAMLETFRWPSTKRMDPEQKLVATKEALTLAAGGQEEVADFVIENQTAILEGFEAGRVKREINPKAKEGLAAWRAAKAAEKEAAANGAGTEVAEVVTEETTKPAAPKKK
jgi:hypothetical protein